MRTVPVVLTLAVVALVAQASALTPFLGTYAAGGTAVVKSDGTTFADAGALTCSASTGAGVGGACISWANAAGMDSVLVNDATGSNVAYQVCVDNDGDGTCSAISLTGACNDRIFFSHADGGVFFNPLGPLPTSFDAGCPGGFPGWLVFLCTGVHSDAAAGPHQHAATVGAVGPVTGGTGYGDFCSGADPANGSGAGVKAYVVTP